MAHLSARRGRGPRRAVDVRAPLGRERALDPAVFLCRVWNDADVDVRKRRARDRDPRRHLRRYELDRRRPARLDALEAALGGAAAGRDAVRAELERRMIGRAAAALL